MWKKKNTFFQLRWYMNMVNNNARPRGAKRRAQGV